MTRLVSLACVLGLVWWPSSGKTAERSAFGLIIGYNGSDDPKKAPLRYADDDAVRNADLLRQLGVPGGVVLLTRLETESKELYPDANPAAPTRRAVLEAMRSLNQRMQQARLQGTEPQLYLFYSGHGDVENNQGYVNLEDGRWTRDDILDLLRGSRAPPLPRGSQGRSPAGCAPRAGSTPGPGAAPRPPPVRSLSRKGSGG